MEDDNTEIVVEEYTCRECGATFYTTSGKKIERCSLCGGKSFDNNTKKDECSYLLIPFKKTIKDAQRDYEKKTSWKPLIPFSFRGKKQSFLIQKVFLPAYLLQANHSGQFLFQGEDREKKAGYIEVKRYDVTETIQADYKNVLLNASNKIPEKKFSNLCRYSFSSAREFNSSDLKEASYLVEDLSQKEMKELGKNKIFKNSILLAQRNIHHAIKRLEEDNTTIEINDSREVLLPVYLLSIRYKNKTYQYFMNGETGKSYMNLPTAFFPTFVFSVIIFAVVFSLGLLIIHYL